MLMGQVQQGLQVVRYSRDRYDGKVRNPFNEYECGHWYARALASYGYLQALTGLRYDAVDKTLYVDSKIGDFTCFISTESGFGTVIYRGCKASVKTIHGKIEVNKINMLIIENKPGIMKVESNMVVSLNYIMKNEVGEVLTRIWKPHLWNTFTALARSGSTGVIAGRHECGGNQVDHIQR
jgi:hypothetical protein